MFDRQTDKERKKNEGKLIKNDLCLTDPWGVLIYESGIYIYIYIYIYMCRPEFGELRERLLTENGGLSERPLDEKRGVEVGTKNNKETYTFKSGVFWSSPCRKSGTNKCIFLKRGVFRCGPGRKRGVFRSGPGRQMGRFLASHTRTALIWEYPPLPHTPRADENEGKIINKLPLLDRQTDKERMKNEGKLIKNDLCLTDPRGVLIYESGIYMCRPEIGELRERPPH